jgi:RHS repeat-associated protein
MTSYCKFNTHELDQTGLSYFQARYYDSDTGRFISPDPTIPNPESTQHYNRYMFVAGNPVSFMDVSGYSDGDEDGDGDSDDGSGSSSIVDQVVNAAKDAWDKASSAVSEASQAASEAVNNIINNRTNPVQPASDIKPTNDINSTNQEPTRHNPSGEVEADISTDSIIDGFIDGFETHYFDKIRDLNPEKKDDAKSLNDFIKSFHEAMKTVREDNGLKISQELEKTELKAVNDYIKGRVNDYDAYKSNQTGDYKQQSTALRSYKMLTKERKTIFKNTLNNIYKDR